MQKKKRKEGRKEQKRVEYGKRRRKKTTSIERTETSKMYIYAKGRCERNIRQAVYSFTPKTLNIQRRPALNLNSGACVSRYLT